MAAFPSEILVTQTLWATKHKILTVWPFTTKACCPCGQTLPQCRPFPLHGWENEAQRGRALTARKQRRHNVNSGLTRASACAFAAVCWSIRLYPWKGAAGVSAMDPSLLGGEKEGVAGPGPPSRNPRAPSRPCVPTCIFSSPGFRRSALLPERPFCSAHPL